MKSPQTAVSSFHKKVPRRIASTHVLACISLALLATACSKKTEDASSSVAPVITATTASQAAVASTPAPVAPSAPAAASADKLQDYIACYNQLDRNAHRSIARYRSWVKDMDAGPSGKEMVVYGLYKIDVADIAKCKTSFAQAVKGTPGKLDAARRSTAPDDRAGSVCRNGLDRLFVLQRLRHRVWSK